MRGVVPGAGVVASVAFVEAGAAPGLVVPGAVAGAGALAAAPPAEGGGVVVAPEDVVLVGAVFGTGFTNNAWYAYRTTNDRKIARRTRRSMGITNSGACPP